MSQFIEVNDWQKFTLLTSKNFYISMKNYQVAILVPLVPSLFTLLLVMVRLMTEVTYRPSKIFRRLTANRSWTHLMSDIEKRREIIKAVDPTFKHSVYVPQLLLAVAPSTFEYTDVIDQAKADYIHGMNYITFDSCDELKQSMQEEHYFAGICFSINFQPSSNVEITYVFPSELRIYNDSYIGSHWHTDTLYDHFNSFDKRMEMGHDGGFVGYIREGFIAIQHAVSMVYIDRELEESAPDIKIQRFPFHAHTGDPLTDGWIVTMSLVFVLGYLYPVFIITNTIVKEKKSNGKDVLKTLGIPNWIQVLSWFTVFMSLTSISSLIITTLLKIDWINGRSILPQVHMGFLLLFFTVYNAATINFCILVSVFSSEPKHVVPLTGIIWVCSYVPYVSYFNDAEWLTNVWPFMYLFCNAVLAFVFDQIMENERFCNHVEISYLHINENSNHKMCGLAYIGVLLLLSIAYCGIALYIENLNLDIYERLRIRHLISRPKRDTNPNQRFTRRAFMREGMVYEIEPQYKTVIVKTEELCKVFDGEYAVKDVNLNIYEGDITVFMGHNGSGKTVLLKLIAGLLIPTSGKIFIENSNVDFNIMSRRNIGISLDEGLLFPELSAYDQLTLFARLRGLTASDLKKDVSKYLHAMELYDRRDDLPKHLNKAEKHFLSVCCALVGRPKIVLLDEPSKWLDSMARRAMWELLRSESKTKTVIVTTNNEEEAESLGDRIGIFCWGELKCFGSSFFLKKIYGQGHRMILYRDMHFDKDAVTDVVQKYEPTATFEAEMGLQISYILNNIAQFVALADELEERAEELGINGIAISEMSSGDIFLKKGAQDPTDGDRLLHSEMMNGDTIYFRNSTSRYFDTGTDRVSNMRLFFNQCKVLLKKRLLSTIRIFQQSLLQLLIPIVLTTVSFSFLSSRLDLKVQKQLEFNLQAYDYSESIFHITRDGMTDLKKNQSLKAYREELFWLGNAHKEMGIFIDNDNIYEEILEIESKTSDLINNRRMVGVIFEKNAITALFHNYQLHTAPLSLNLVYNAVMRSSISTFTLRTNIFPLPFETKYKGVHGHIPLSIPKYLAIDVSFCVGFSWTLGVIFLVRERKKNFKFYQHLLGVRGWVFWLNHFIYDIIIILATTLIIEITCILFDTEPFGEFKTTFAFFLTLSLAGVFMCSANYLVSVLWKDPIMAYITVSMLNALGTTNYWIFMETYSHGFSRETKSDFFKFLRIFPHFSLCSALIKSLTLSEMILVCDNKALRHMSIDVEKCEMHPNCCGSYEHWAFGHGVYSELSIILAYGILCWVLLIVIECFNFISIKPNQDERKNVPQKNANDFNVTSWDRRKPPKKTFAETIEKEKQEVFKMRSEKEKEKVLICNQVNCNVYGNFSFNDVTFTVNHAECLIILGKNGSGKTSLINTFLGAVPLTSGSIKISGLNLKSHSTDIYKRIGYCPAEDVFLSEFKLIELIEMVCLLKGIPGSKIKSIAESVAKMLGLYNQLGKRLKICSSGVKRRFIFACALIGNPELVFFDDIATSLDVASQRQVWKAIGVLRAKGRSAIVTSTTTRECECIANRFLVLSGGYPILITDPLSLHDFYKSGYILRMKIKKVSVSLPSQTDDWIVPKYQSFSANPFIKLATFIENEFPIFLVKEKLGNIIEYFIPKSGNSISRIFRLMQRNAFNLYVEDFSITTCTLPMLFIEILENEEEES